MSSSDDYIASLASVQKYLYRYGGPIFMISGNISCIISLIVFTRKNLRKNPCSIYFTAYNIASFFYIYSGILSPTLANGYDIRSTAYNLILCRLVFYTAFLFDSLSSFYLILASINRILIYSPNARTRSRNTRRLACLCTISGTLFWILFHSHTLVFSNILQFTSGYPICYFQPGIYTILIGYYSLIIKGILVPYVISHFWSMDFEKHSKCAND